MSALLASTEFTVVLTLAFSQACATGCGMVTLEIKKRGLSINNKTPPNMLTQNDCIIGPSNWKFPLTPTPLKGLLVWVLKVVQQVPKAMRIKMIKEVLECQKGQGSRSEVGKGKRKATTSSS